MARKGLVGHFQTCTAPRSCCNKYLLAFLNGTKLFELLLLNGGVCGTVGGFGMLGNPSGSFVIGKIVHLSVPTNLRTLFKHFSFQNILPGCKTEGEAVDAILALYNNKNPTRCSIDSLFYVWGLVVMEHRMGKGPQMVRCTKCSSFVLTTPAHLGEPIICTDNQCTTFPPLPVSPNTQSSALVRDVVCVVVALVHILTYTN